MTVLQMFRRRQIKPGMLLKAMKSLPIIDWDRSLIIRGRAYRVVDVDYSTRGMLTIKGEASALVTFRTWPRGWPRDMKSVQSRRWAILGTF